jgi:hypothetical protein
MSRSPSGHAFEILSSSGSVRWTFPEVRPPQRWSECFPHHRPFAISQDCVERNSSRKKQVSQKMSSGDSDANGTHDLLRSHVQSQRPVHVSRSLLKACLSSSGAVERLRAYRASQLVGNFWRPDFGPRSDHHPGGIIRWTETRCCCADEAKPGER